MTVDLNLASSLFGPIDGVSRMKLMAVLEDPTVETWDAAYSLILNRDSWTTLWQAVLAVDPTFSASGPCRDQHGVVIEPWQRVPDRSTLRQAINYATR